MALNLRKKVMELLSSNPGRKYTAREIAEWIFETYRDECEKKRERSTANVLPLNDDKALIQQLVSEIGANRKFLSKRHPELRTIEERPRKYYYTTETEQDEIERSESEEPSTSTPGNESARIQEHDLYPILKQFLWTEHQIYSMRIDERRSSNNRGTGGNDWLYPDLVAMEDLTVSWDDKVKDCAQQYSDKKTKLWSFEVKLHINRTNIRKTFFQAVSNSSWANYGYLVAAELSGSDTEQELRILSSLHGIGFILLNPENLDESRTIIPARERTDVDWDTANRLVEQNRDFESFIEEVTRFYQTGRIKLSDWGLDED